MSTKKPKWSRVVRICAALRLGEAATFSANQLRAILHVYRATNLYKFTVKRNGNVITVTRVGSWEGIQQAPG